MGNRLLVVVVFLLSGLIVRQLLKPPEPTPQERERQVIAAFNKAAEELNRQGPHMVDPVTRLDKAEVGPGARFTYHYTLIAFPSQALIQAQIEDKLRLEMLGKVCGNAGMARALQYGGTYVYNYKGSDDVEAVNVAIDRNACGQPVALRSQ